MVRMKGGRGVSLVEVAVGLGIMGMVGLGVVQVLNDQTEASKAMGAAVQLDQVRAATHDWLRANYQQLIANLPAGGAPVLVPVARTVAGGAVPGPVTVGAAVLPSLQGGGFLPGNAVDLNAYGHRHTVLVRQGAAGSLEAMVLQTGGRPIRDADLGRIVQRVGSSGGARFATNANPAMATMVQGNGGAWAADSAVWVSGGVSPQVSRAAAQVSFGNASMLSDFVNRYDIGIPEANTMRTALNMGANDLANAATVRANQAVLQSGGMACASNATGCAFWISNDGRFADFNDGWIRFQGQTAGGGLTVEGAGGNLTVAQNAGVAGDIAGGRDLSIARAGSIGQDLGVGRHIGVTGDIYGGRDLWMLRNSWVSGDSTIGGNMGVSGNSVVWGNHSTVGNASVIGSVNVGSGLNVNGSTFMNGGLNTTGGVASASWVYAPTVLEGGQSVNQIAQQWAAAYAGQYFSNGYNAGWGGGWNSGYWSGQSTGWWSGYCAASPDC